MHHMKLLKQHRTKLLIFGVLCVLGTAVLQKAHAQSGPKYSLTVSPTLVEIRMKPGKQVIKAFTLTNNGSSDLEITPSIRSFTDKDGMPMYLPDSSPPSFVSLFNTDKKLNEPFILKQKQIDQVILQITPSETLQERDYYFSLFFSGRSAASSQSGEQTMYSGQAEGQIAIQVLLTIANTADNKGKLVFENIRLPKLIDSFFPFPFQAEARNIGTEYSPIQGSLTIKPKFFYPEESHDFLPENILAGSTRPIRIMQNTDSTQNTPPDTANSTSSGEKRADRIFQYKKPFLFGPVSVTAKIGDAANSDTYEQTVVAVPFVLIGILVLLAGIPILYRRYTQSLITRLPKSA